MSSVTYDPETEAMLDQWVEAKRARDFKTSDAIQRELQAEGIDTNAARPDTRKAGLNLWSARKGSGASFPAANGGAYDSHTEAKLDEWVAAKRARDFTTSDAIQRELEAQGIDTNAARPDPKKGDANLWAGGGGFGANLWAAGGGNGGAHDPRTEAKLDEWVAAKRARDFTTSDAIQRELEAQGIEPKFARPDPKKGGANLWAGGGGCEANLWAAGGGGGGCWGGGGGCGTSLRSASQGAYDPDTEAKLDEWVAAKRARDFTTSDAIQRELEAQGIDTNAARPDPKKGGWNPWAGGEGCGANLWAAGGGGYDSHTEAMLDEWVAAKRDRNFTKSDAIQVELQAQGIDPNTARPDPRKAGANPSGPWSMNIMTGCGSMGFPMMMMMPGCGSKGFGKARWGPY